MGAVKNLYHDEITWNALDDDERQEWLAPSPDRNPKGGDAKQGSVEDEGRFPAPKHTPSPIGKDKP